MALEKDRIVLGDTYLVHYTCWKKGSLRDYRDSSVFSDPASADPTGARTPIIPLMAEVTLFSVIDQAVIPLDDLASEAVATVTANHISYLIAAEKLATAGDYKVFTRVVLDDGQTLTMIRNLSVREMS